MNPDTLTSSAPPGGLVRYESGELRLVQLTADQHGLAGLDRDGRVWAHIPGNGWTPIPMNAAEERKGP